MENPPARGRGGRGPAGSPTPLPRHEGEIRDGETITLGDLKVNAVAVPGHTPGSMGFIFPVKTAESARRRAVRGRVAHAADSQRRSAPDLSDVRAAL